MEDTGQGRAVVHLPLTADLQRQTVEKMFQMDPQFGNYLYLPRDKKLVPMGPGEPLEGALTKDDLEASERYLWALALSKSPVIEEMKKALGEMVEVRALIQTALWTLGSMLLIMALNPLVPGLVAVVGVGLILYVGVDTLINLVNGWRQLMEEVKVAATFEQLRDAGERFGKIIGREAARAFAMEDPANKMPLQGHYGPHPERYHQIVMDELASATAACRSAVDCRERLTRALKALAKDIATPGTELNQLVTRATPR